jgi:hypothetical protein
MWRIWGIVFIFIISALVTGVKNKKEQKKRETGYINYFRPKQKT